MAEEMVKLQKLQSREIFRKQAARALDHPNAEYDGNDLTRTVELGKVDFRHRETAKGEFRRI